MTTFKQFIANEHATGTYVNAKLSSVDKDALYKWVNENGISNPLDKSEYHVTIVYSKAPCPDAEDYPFKFPIVGNITGWKIFDANIGRCLVATIQSEQLDTINSNLINHYGATSDFPTYIPHITVSYDYEGELPTDYPAWQVVFDAVQVKGLDPNWKPSK